MGYDIPEDHHESVPHPSPHARRDKTEEFDMRKPGDGVRGAGQMTEAEIAREKAMDSRWDRQYENAGFVTSSGEHGNKVSRKSQTLASLAAEMRPEPAKSETLGDGATGGGKRFNKGKNRMELTLPEWDWALADVSTKGSYKYEEWNWLLGMKWSSMLGCMKRHTAKFEGGERYDGEKFDIEAGTTGCHHLAMVAWNALALMTYDLRQIGEDDRAELVRDLKELLDRINAETSDLE